ncbi:hypothetical protein CHS0354_033278 [Potamilus streckersoni]|uniref:Steroid 21-hydroxylase n=1 Tax=Potamilus streckersoni TaxID=2493646 RepID=A0AAE0S788_9BIVA|nr:hypothetical protein CHS0354_033278 [Potamilus streckersoni]
MLEILLILLVIILFVYNTTSKSRNLPPGPKPIYPIIGNLPAVAGKDVLLAFREMRTKYGDIFSLYFGHQLMIVINGYETIKAVLVKHGALFSERPHNFLSDEMCQGRGIIFSTGKIWKEQRRFSTSAFQELGFGKLSFEESIKTEVLKVLEFFEEKQECPIDIKECIFASITNIIFSIVMGKRYNYDDPAFHEFLLKMVETSQLVGNASILVNCFPFLRYCPFDPLKKNFALQNRDKIKSFFKDTYEEHRKTYNREYIRDFVDLYIREIEKNAEAGTESTFSEEMLNSVIGDLFGAGGETSTTAVCWAFLYLVRHPEIQARIREEVDNVVGPNKIPSYSDRHKLPFLEATIFEVLRLGDVVPLAIPHAVPNNVFFCGYTIPKDSSILINLNSISHDPVLFNNPTHFKPERFLDSSGTIKNVTEFIPFSIGRRRCIGSTVARMELFLFISAVLSKFELVPPEGQPPPDPVGILGITNMPRPYKLRAVFRRNSS